MRLTKQKLFLEEEFLEQQFFENFRVVSWVEVVDWVSNDWFINWDGGNIGDSQDNEQCLEVKGKLKVCLDKILLSGPRQALMVISDSFWTRCLISFDRTNSQLFIEKLVTVFLKFELVHTDLIDVNDFWFHFQSSNLMFNDLFNDQCL